MRIAPQLKAGVFVCQLLCQRRRQGVHEHIQTGGNTGDQCSGERLGLWVFPSSLAQEIEAVPRGAPQCFTPAHACVR